MNGLLIAGKLLVILLGLTVVYQGYRAYRRHHNQPMLSISIGFLFLTAGSAMDCTILAQIHVSSPLSGLLQTATLGIGMIFVLCSIYQ